MSGNLNVPIQGFNITVTNNCTELSDLTERQAEITALIEELVDKRKIFSGNLVSLESFENKTFTVKVNHTNLFEIPQNTVNHRLLSSALKTLKNKGKVENTLYLFSSGGGGHKSAKDALKTKMLQEVKEKLKEHFKTSYPKSSEKTDTLIDDLDDTPFEKLCSETGLFEEVDTLHDFLGAIGKMATKEWDEAQRMGNVKKQERLAAQQPLANRILTPFVFLKTLSLLIKKQPTKVVSTQAMANGAIVAAIFVYNKLFKPKKAKDLRLKLYMTDMPTKHSDHFFHQIKSMFPFQQGMLTLYAPEIPQGNDNLTVFIENAEKKIKQVTLTPEELPIRPAFIRMAQAAAKSSKQIAIKINSAEEHARLNTLSANPETVPAGGSYPRTIEFPLADEQFFIMLGSQPTEAAIKAYIQVFIKKAKANPNKSQNLFLFLGKYEKESLYTRIAEELQGLEIPPNLQIIPMTYQDADQLVALYSQCNTITRSGGGTAMELLVIQKILKKADTVTPLPMRYIHAEKIKDRSLEDSIPLWERGNFHFLRDEIGAKVISPDTL